MNKITFRSFLGWRHLALVVVTSGSAILLAGCGRGGLPGRAARGAAAQVASGGPLGFATTMAPAMSPQGVGDRTPAARLRAQGRTASAA